MKTVNGVTYRTFCGPAKAQASIGKVGYRFDKPKYSYFGITVFNAKAGKNANAPAIAWQLPGKRYGLLYSTVTLAPGLKKGSFAGKLIGTDTVVTGGFTCAGAL